MTALTATCEGGIVRYFQAVGTIYSTMSALPDSMPDPVAEKILSLVAMVKRLPREQVRIDSSFDELGIDSLDGTMLMFEIEGVFDISIPDEQARSIRSVRQAVDGVKSLLPAQGAG